METEGTSGRRKEITDLTDRVSIRTICAIPDPHIERWLMIDAAAFKQVFGIGCAAPDQKYERNRYKRPPVEAIRAAGVFPSLGGMEFADDIMAALDMDRAVAVAPSLGHFVGDLRALFIERGH